MRRGEVRSEVAGLRRAFPADSEHGGVLPDLEAEPDEKRAMRVGLDLRLPSLRAARRRAEKAGERGEVAATSGARPGEDDEADRRTREQPPHLELVSHCEYDGERDESGRESE